MDRDNRFFDDFAKVAEGAMSSLSALRDEAEVRMRGQVERFLEGMDMVRRDEFEAVREMAVKARAENEALSGRIAALETALRAAGASESDSGEGSRASPDSSSHNG